MANLIVYAKGAAPWAGPGWIAVDVPGVPGSYYQLPNGKIVDGTTGADQGWYAVPDNSARAGRSAADLNRLELGQQPTPISTSSGSAITTPGRPGYATPAPPLAKDPPTIAVDKAPPIKDPPAPPAPGVCDGVNGSCMRAPTPWGTYAAIGAGLVGAWLLLRSRR